MIEILHYLKDPKLWELWYTPYYGQCRIYIINRSITTTYPAPEAFFSSSRRLVEGGGVSLSLEGP